MGQATVLSFCPNSQTSFNHYREIFAGCFNAKESQLSFDTSTCRRTRTKICYRRPVTIVPLDVMKDECVSTAGKTVQDYQNIESKKKLPEGYFGLTGVCVYRIMGLSLMDQRSNAIGNE